MCQGAFREVAIDVTPLDFCGNFEVTVYRMKMSRTMIPKLHRDYDAKKAAELGRVPL